MSDSPLSQAQFYRSVAERTLKDGGSTQHIETGHVPSQGYMVSDMDRQHVVPASGYTGSKVADYANRHKEALSQPDAYLGTWRASRENAAGQPVRQTSDMVYTDTSRRFPTAEEALPAMEEQQQLATYVLHTGREHSLEQMQRALQTTEPAPVPNPAVAWGEHNRLGSPTKAETPTSPMEALQITEPRRDQASRIQSEKDFRERERQARA